MQPPPLVIIRPEPRELEPAPPPPPHPAQAQLDEAQAADAAGRHEDAVALLRQAVDAGHPAAMSFLGARLLIGRAAPLAPREGLAMLTRAAGLDEADAHAILGTVAASSALTPEQWRPALDHLQRAAELGSVRAQQQLRLLSGQTGALTAGLELWGRLRRVIDVAAWLRPPAKRVLCEGPRLRTIDGFLPAVACDWLTARAHRCCAPPPSSTCTPARPGRRRPAATARWNSTSSTPTW